MQPTSHCRVEIGFECSYVYGEILYMANRVNLKKYSDKYFFTANRQVLIT